MTRTTIRNQTSLLRRLAVLAGVAVLAAPRVLRAQSGEPIRVGVSGPITAQFALAFVPG